MTKLKVGVIGNGAWGKRIQETLLAKTKHCEWKWSTSDREAPFLVPVDFVVIATPYATHAKLMEQCFERDIPFIVEKPAANYFELLKLQKKFDPGSLSGASNAHPFLVNHTLLFNPAIESMVYFAHKSADQTTPIKLRGEHGGPGPVRSDCNALLDYGSHGVALGLWISRAENVRGVRLHVGKKNTKGFLDPKPPALFNSQNFVLHAHFEHLKLELRVGNNYPKKRLLYTLDYEAGPSYLAHRFREFPERELLSYIESDLWEMEFARDIDPLTNALDTFARVVKGERPMDERFGWDLPLRTMQVLESCEMMLRAEERGPEGALN